MRESKQEPTPQAAAHLKPPTSEAPVGALNWLDRHPGAAQTMVMPRIQRLGRSPSSPHQNLLLHLQRQHGNAYVQRLINRDRQGDADAASEVAADVEAGIEQARGHGQPLDRPVQRQMESAFGTDFSSVRVHTNSGADTLNQALSARAFTTGQDIFFRQGEYSPGSSGGKELLAHELTHVVQQTGGIQAKLAIGQPGDIYEQEADQVAKAFVQQEAQDLSKPSPEPQVEAPLGGESQEEDGQMLLGGERRDRALGLGTIQRQEGGTPAAPAAPAALTYSTVTPRTSQGCGGYTYAVRWGLSGAGAGTNGFIVQKLTFDLKRQICAGGTNDFAKTYWEAWQVRGGNIFVGTSTSPHSADTFRVGPTLDQKGINFEEGYAKYIPDYTDPLSWGTVPEAGSLPATTTQPAGWSNAGALHRSIRSTFDCCDRSDIGVIEGDG